MHGLPHRRGFAAVAGQHPAHPPAGTCRAAADREPGIQTALSALGSNQPDAALRSRVQAFQTRERQANEELQRTQTNLQSIQQNVLRQINARLGPAVNQVMVQRGANIAVDVDATLAHSQSTNVTAAVLAALNATLPSVSLTPSPAQQQPAQSPGR